MGVWHLKGCPRCGGDMYLARDIFGWYMQCLQCSQLKDVEFDEQGNAKEVDPVSTMDGRQRKRGGRW
jgi:hypothetical protein